MRKSQWNFLGFVFMGASLLFFWLASIWSSSMILPLPTNYTSGQLMIYTVSSIKYGVYGAFGSILFILSISFWICAWLEGRAEKKEEKERDDELWRDAKEKDFVMKVAQKLELEHLPQDIPELVFWGKKEGKEKEVDEAVKEWTERELLRLTMLQEKYGGKLSQEDKEWLIEKKKKYPDEYVG